MQTVAEMLLARRDDDGIGLRFEDTSWTWRAVVQQCAVRASLLSEWRAEGPFHIGVLLDNVPEYVFLLGGAALAGVTVVGVNPTRRGAELGRDIAQTDCQVLVTDSGQEHLTGGTGVEPGRIQLADGDGYRSALARHTLAQLPDRLPPPDTLFLLLFTSGSTGSPKAVRMSQRRLAAAALATARGAGLTAEDVAYCAMPLFHGNALASNAFPALAAGATLVLRRRFSASGFLPDVRRYGVTYFNYVGRALGFVLATPEHTDDSDNSLRLGLGTEASPRDISEFRRRFGCRIVEGYGSSEGAIHMSRVPGTPRSALGRPPPGMDVAIVDPATSQECPPAVLDGAGRILNASEAIGEIVSRDGVARFEGYYGNPEADAERTRGGWFWSGDLGYRDEDGFFYFAGRAADWLRVDGENFGAAPVERVLSRFPGVLAAAVYPVPDPSTADQVMVAFELARGAPFDPDRFVSFLEAQADLGTKWAPRFVRIVDRLPLTPTSKVDKQPLRADRWNTTDPIWWRPLRERAYRALTDADVAELHRQFDAHGRQALLTVS